MKLKNLDGGTIFQVLGRSERSYKKGSIGGPICQQNGEWIEWNSDCATEKVCGCGCEPKRGGRFQSSKNLCVWFPESQEVTADW